MKKVLLFFSFCFALASMVCGQVDYFHYHAIVNEAETQWSRQDFRASLALYDSAFAAVDYVFVKDYLIAAQVAALDGDWAKALSFMQKAMAGDIMICGG